MIYLSAFDPRARYLTGMGQAFNPRAPYLTGLRRHGLGQDVPNLTPNFPAFPGSLRIPWPEPPMPIVFPDSGSTPIYRGRVVTTTPPPNLSPAASTYPATLPSGILAQPTPYALLPASPSNVVQQAGGWLQQQSIAGIPNKYLLIGGGVLLFLLMSGGARSRRRRRNVAAGFYDEDGVFHPIRASYDYSRSRAGERRRRRR